MNSDSGPGTGPLAARELSDQARATILQRLDAIAPEVLSGVDRTARIAVTDAGGEVITIFVAMNNGHVNFASPKPAEDQTVGISTSIGTAIALGDGSELLEDAYAAGTLTVERARPEDFRLAPLLETLFEALIDAGVLDPADGPAMPLATRPLRQSGFADVEGSGNIAALLSYLDVSAEDLADVKERMRTMLAARPGDRVLDVGCGAGHEAVNLAARGVVAVGADLSMDMVLAARSRAAAEKQWVAVAQADCHALPFAAGAFDGCRIERVLQHIESPERVLAECRRVIRPGGGIVIFEPDWESLTFDSAQTAISAAITSVNAMAHRHPAAGKELASLLADAGFSPARFETTTAGWLSIEEMDRSLSVSTAVRRAVKAGAISPSDGQAWITDQRQRSGRGCFRATLDRGIAWVPIGRCGD